MIILSIFYIDLSDSAFPIIINQANAIEKALA